MANCTQCGGSGADQAGRCRKCWLMEFGRHKRKYFFTEALTADLRAAYHGDKTHLSRALDRLTTLTKWPRDAFKREANRLGLVRRGDIRPWTPEEDAYLAETLGAVSMWAMARKLGRTRWSIESRAARLDLSRRVKWGYNLTDLAVAFGVHRDSARRWVARGLLGRTRAWQGVRVEEKAVARFIRRYPHEYDLRRVDQTWFKAMVFGDLAKAKTGEE